MTSKEQINKIINSEKNKMSASVNYNIMAHPSRKDYIPYLEAKLGKVKVIWDTKESIVDTRIKCLEDHIKSGKDFGITIQDDSIVTDDFKKKAEMYIKKIGDPEGIYNFYYATKNPERLIYEKIDNNQYYITDEDYHEVWKGRKYTLHNEICFAMPTKYMKKMIKYIKNENLSLSDGRKTDAFMQWWIVENDIKVYFPLPSIIDHRAYAHSLHLPAKNKWNVCWWFDTDEEPKVQYGVKSNKRVSFNYNIMAHESRRELALELQRELKCDIIWDNSSNVWDTRKRCLENHIDSRKDIGITIQDDCLLVPNFKQSAELFVREHPGDYAYNFFYMKGKHKLQEFVANIEQGFVKKKFFMNEIAFGMPIDVMPGLIDFCKDSYSDAELSGWISTNLTTYYPIPSLVEHKQVPSIYYEKPGIDRYAWWFAGNESPIKDNARYGYKKNDKGKFVRVIVGYDE